MVYPLPENIIEKTQLPHTLHIKRSDGIVEIRCMENVQYDVQEVMENHEVLKNFAATGKVLVLNITTKYNLISNEAREYISKGPHKDFIAAEAFLIHSLAQRLLARFYFAVFKPIVPAKYFAFHEKEEAEKWLRLQQQLD